MIFARRLVLLIILAILSAVTAAVLLHTADEKGRCLDYGGRYDDVHKSCVK